MTLENALIMREKAPLVVILTVVLVAISAPHTAEDFQFGAFSALGIVPAIPGIILGLTLAVQVTGVYLVARRSRLGFALLVAAGAVWSVGAIVFHGPAILASGAYRYGFISKAMEVAIIVVGAATAIAGWFEWRRGTSG